MRMARQTGGCFEASYCTDCTPEYQKTMVRHGRCWHPEITFITDPDGFLQGTQNGNS